MDNYWKLWKNADKVFIVTAICFAILSITMITSISYKNGQVILRDIVIQSIAYGLGFIAAAAMILCDYRKFQDFSKALYIGSLLFLLTVYVPGLGIVSNGARSWINLGFTTFQPSEIVKISFTILMANYFSRNKAQLSHLRGVTLAALYAAPFIFIVVKEDLGSAIVYCFIWVFMIFLPASITRFLPVLHCFFYCRCPSLTG